MARVPESRFRTGQEIPVPCPHRRWTQPVRRIAARRAGLHLRLYRAPAGMRILVTGAGGFLGSHLCDRLLADGHRVIGMDNYITGALANLAHLAHHPAFQLVTHDVTTFIEVEGPLDGV